MTDYVTATGVVRRALERHSYQLIGGLISDYSRDQFFAVIRQQFGASTEVKLITIGGELFLRSGAYFAGALASIANKAFKPAPAPDNKIDTALRVGNAENRADAAEHKVHTLEMKLENANQTIDQAQWELSNLREFETMAKRRHEKNQKLEKQIADLLAEREEFRGELDRLRRRDRFDRVKKMIDVGLISPADAERILGPEACDLAPEDSISTRAPHGLTAAEIRARERYVQRRLAERFQPAVVGPVQYTPRGDRFWRLTRSGRRDARFSLTEHELTFRTIGSWECFIAERIESLVKRLAATEPTHQPRVPVDSVVGPLTSIVRGMDDVSPKTLRNQLEDIIEDIDQRAE